MNEKGWQTFLLAGVDTGACVMATTFDLFDWGRQPILLADLCGSGGEKAHHEAALKAAERAIGAEQVLKSEGLLLIR